MSVTIHGASDDLIEVGGDIYDEFPYQDYDGDRGGDLLAFSDGTVLRIRHDDAGIWRISPVAHGSADLVIVQAPEDDDTNYTDRATLSAAAWVVQGVAHATAKKAADPT